MSRSLTKADAIAAHLATLPALSGMDISVHREQDLLSQVNTAFEKAAGTGCVIVKWLGGKNPDRKSGQLRLGGRYSVSLWTKPVIADDETPADDLIEAMGGHLHGWVDTRQGVPVMRLEVDDIAIVPADVGFLVHEILAEVSRI